MKDIKNNLEEPDTCKIQIKIVIGIISFKDTTVNGKGDDAIDELFESLFSKYQIGLEISVKAGDMIIDCVHLFC